MYNTNIDIKRKPFIGKGENKFIFPLEYTSISNLNENVEKIIKELNSTGIEETSFIIIPKHTSNNNPRNFESFFEYVVSRKFNQMGYITDTQIPFYYGIGTPDLAAYKIPDLQSLFLQKKYYLPAFSVIEGMTIRIFGRRSMTFDISQAKNQESIVFEAKVNQTSAETQIKKYISLNIFNEAFEIIPVTKRVMGTIGLVSVNSTGELIITHSPQKLIIDLAMQNRYLKWVVDYLKCYFLANLEGEELEEILRNSKNPMNSDGFNNFIRNTKLENLLTILENYY